uniref:ENPP3 n=1 Tax=Angiostrongylus cantonensis TaxID=6313 RepID=A0A0K0DJE2_ANGCA
LNENTCSFPAPSLLILSMDGFSREYLNRFKLSSLNYLAKCGAMAERVYPSFPSRTFPNHYTMVTGLYPESHGIVDNSVYDPSLSDIMENMKNTQKQGYFLGDPIWNVYKRHGGRTACLFWPGCAYNISGMSLCGYSAPYSLLLTCFLNPYLINNRAIRLGISKVFICTFSVLELLTKCPAHSMNPIGD